jgi:hypothetical protein
MQQKHDSAPDGERKGELRSDLMDGTAITTPSQVTQGDLVVRMAEILAEAKARPHPDAELLELARQRQALIDAIDGAQDDDEGQRLGDEWLNVDTRIMELQPKTGAGLAVQLAVVWRDLDMEPGEESGPCPETLRSRMWLWRAKQNAAKLAEDSATLDAFREFLSAQCGWGHEMSDEEASALSDRCDALALEVMKTEPTTAAGFAAQLYTWLHLQHGGKARNPLTVDYRDIYSPEEEGLPHQVASRTLVNRSFRMTEAIRGEERFRSSLRQMDNASLDGMLDAVATAADQLAETDQGYTFPDRIMELVAEANAAMMAENAAVNTTDPAGLSELDREFLAAWKRVPDERKAVELRWMKLGVASGRFHRMALNFAESIGRADAYRLDLRMMADKGGDADLLDLGRLHEDAIRDADAVHAIARPEEEAERLYARISGLKDRIFATEATTLAGLAVQLAALWDLQGPTLEEEGGPTEDSDIGLKAVWNIWQTARKLSGQDADIRPASRKVDNVSPEKCADTQRIFDIYDQLDASGKAVLVAVSRATIHLQQATNIAKAAGAEYPEALEGVAKMMRADAALLEAAANDHRFGADAFADTVAAFEAEAPETLSLPLEPTGRMIDAGAGAAGITPEQFQAAYAAAVEALKLERAA